MASAKELVAEATREIQSLSAAVAVELMADPNIVLVDVRDGEELKKLASSSALCSTLRVARVSRLTRQARPTSRSSGLGRSWCSFAAQEAVLPL